MKIIISPAKSLDFQRETPHKESSNPIFLNDAEDLIKELKKLSPEEIGTLMGISHKLSEMNFYRYQSWNKDLEENTRQAIFAFDGDVYKGLNAYSFNKDDIGFAQNHLRILSGLYGVLKPLDRIKPYRLEMGIKLKNKEGNNLYDYWKDIITNYMNKEFEHEQEKVLINLASEEYSKVLNGNCLNKDIKVVSPIFKEYKNKSYKIIAVYAKKARGLMSSYIIKNKIDNLNGIKRFDLDGYVFREDLSLGNQIIFTRN
ncbi:peroxide stress protein YaaA [Clostridium sp. MSJ-4]|uniref:UPF0246 protein KQI89_01350 n=1 Tax=Clostridium simiarum TaxID=2841506 RepID=A0ABS6EW03_9CLOT|nr:peroxide stress protein YaaA [Clostridium simiarum]MBU5590399.1 peroxide stress protein YaaA [Clostridium simiarum]